MSYKLQLECINSRTHPFEILTSVPRLTSTGGWVRNGAVALDDIAHDSTATRTISGGNATRTYTFADRIGKCIFALKLRTSTLMQNNRASLFLSLHSNSSTSPLLPLEFPSVKLHPLIINQTPNPSKPGYRLSQMCCVDRQTAFTGLRNLRQCGSRKLESPMENSTSKRFWICQCSWVIPE